MGILGAICPLNLSFSEFLIPKEMNMTKFYLKKDLPGVKAGMEVIRTGLEFFSPEKETFINFTWGKGNITFLVPNLEFSEWIEEREEEREYETHNP